MPTAPTINAESLRTAANAGRDALRELIRGPENSLYERSDQLTRAREVTQILPSLQINIAKRRLVLQVTREILQALLSSVRTEQQGQVGERLAQLQAEQQGIISAREAVLRQEREHAEGVQGRAEVEARSLWERFLRAPRMGQALVVGGITAVVVGIGTLLHRGWRRLPNWVRKPLLAVAAFLGIMWLLDWLRGRRGPGLGNPSPAPGTPSETEEEPETPEPPTPDDPDTPDESDESAEVPVRTIAIHCLGPHTIPPISLVPGQEFFHYLIEGETTPIRIDQLRNHINSLRSQPGQQLIINASSTGGTWANAYQEMQEALSEDTNISQYRHENGRSGECFLWDNFSEYASISADQAREHAHDSNADIAYAERYIGGPFDAHAQEYLRLSRAQKAFFEALATFLDARTEAHHTAMMTALEGIEAANTANTTYINPLDPNIRAYFQGLRP